MQTRPITGSEALALGALEAGVQYVSGYPGSPATATVEALLPLAGPGVRVEWSTNEKSAFDAAFGASLAGIRALVCLKSVGLNVALDSLMVSNLAGGDGGFVVLVGDDPGGWGSQNEEDSRLLAAAAEVPLLEPTSVHDARATMHSAFGLSEQFRVPVVIRITRGLALERMDPWSAPATAPELRPPSFSRQADRFNVLPIHVVDMHRRLQAALQGVQTLFECLPLNGGQGSGRLGVIAAGHAFQKLAGVARKSGGPPLRILRLATLNPLPERLVTGFLTTVDTVLVLEETAPYVEVQVQALAQRTRLSLPIAGRFSDHLPRAGELFEAQIAHALKSLLPDWSWPAFEPASRSMPSRQPLCDGCPYLPAFQALLSVMERHGGRDAFIVTGETGCMVRAQLPPLRILDVKYGMGSAIGLAAGLARAELRKRIVALSGDSALLHSGLAELIDASQAGLGLLIVVLANRTTALSGGQPHPASAFSAQGSPRKPVDLAALARAAGVESVQVVDPLDTRLTESAFDEGLLSGKLAVVIVDRACPFWLGDPAGQGQGVAHLRP
jgi:indolepyruvate ferredoxin oxidoreductase alpha subunit